MSLKSSNKVETNIYEIEVTIDGATFMDAVNKVYLRQRKNIQLPGFRKGKAPRQMIERFYGEKVFYEDALEQVYPDAVQAAIEEANLIAVDAPHDVSVVSLEKDGVELKMKVTVKPEVEVSEYKGLKATRKAVEVTDEEVEEEIKKLQERNSRLVTVEDRGAENGDTAEIDFEGFVDGEAFDGGKAENHSLVLGSGQFIPGFEDQIIGHKAGESFDVNVKFPTEYAPELADKEATFKVTLNAIKVKELPEADDEFAKDVSEFDTLEELKADQKKHLEEHKAKDAEDDVEHQLIDQLVEGLKAEIPEVMYDKRVEENVRDFDYRLQSQGMNLETYLQYTGMDMDAFKESYRKSAEHQVKLRLALEKIVELEEIKPTEEELEEEFKKLADAYKMDVEAIKKAVPASELEADINVQKAVKLVKDNAVIKKARKTAAKKPAAKKAEDGEAEEKPKTTKTKKSTKAKEEETAE